MEGSSSGGSLVASETCFVVDSSAAACRADKKQILLP